MFLYCKKCELVFKGSECPGCGRKKLREPAPNDTCFLCEIDAFGGEMLCNVLNDAGIPVIIKRKFGVGMALKIGLMPERIRIYVPYCRLNRSSEILNEIFPYKDIEIMD